MLKNDDNLHLEMRHNSIKSEDTMVYKPEADSELQRSPELKAVEKTQTKRLEDDFDTSECAQTKNLDS